MLNGSTPEGARVCQRCMEHLPADTTPRQFELHSQLHGVKYDPLDYTSERRQTQLELALSIARSGTAVYPQETGNPAFDHRTGPRDATRDEMTIRAWWEKYPRAQVGIVEKARPEPTATPPASTKKVSSLADDRDFRARLAVRIDDAKRSGADMTIAVLRAVDEHMANQKPAAYQVLSETKSVEVIRGAAENTYTIHLEHDGVDARVHLSQEEFHGAPTKFCERYLQHFHLLLDVKKSEWLEIRQGWLTSPTTVVLDGVEEVTPELLTFERMIEKLNASKFTRDAEVALREENWHYFDGEFVWVLSQKVERIVEQAGQGVSMQRFGTVLRERGATAATSVVKKVGKVTRRFWPIKASVLGVTDADLEDPEDLSIPNLDLEQINTEDDVGVP